MSDKNNIKIIATSVEEFNMVLNKLKTLPDSILGQIETAENSNLMSCIKFTFRNQFKTDAEYFIPNNTTQIKIFGDGDSNSIGIYAGDFYFIIPKDAMKYNISYILIPLKEVE